MDADLDVVLNDPDNELLNQNALNIELPDLDVAAAPEYSELLYHEEPLSPFDTPVDALPLTLGLDLNLGLSSHPIDSSSAPDTLNPPVGLHNDTARDDSQSSLPLSSRSVARTSRTPYERPKPDTGSHLRSNERTVGSRHLDSSSSNRNCRVYVGNLAFGCGWQDLKDYMRKCGNVLFADIIMRDGRSLGCGVVEYSSPDDAQRAIRELHDSNHMGRTLLVREDREADSRRPSGKTRSTNRDSNRGPDRDSGSDRYSRNDRTRYDDRSSRGRSGRSYRDNDDRDDRRRVEGRDDRDKKIFVGNLPFVVNWKDLKDLFRKVASVVRAEVFEDHDGRSKGVGTVEFETPQLARNAISMFDGYEWHGRRLEVREDRRPGYQGGGDNSRPSHQDRNDSGRTSGRSQDDGRNRDVGNHGPYGVGFIPFGMPSRNSVGYDMRDFYPNAALGVIPGMGIGPGGPAAAAAAAAFGAYFSGGAGNNGNASVNGFYPGFDMFGGVGFSNGGIDQGKL
ncbi:g-strand binding protein, variant 2 [Batrachochytrium dendrobatidis]|nr:g-strand binding protein, variant 2 [Batrachochytrium dendrobatidis]